MSKLASAVAACAVAAVVPGLASAGDVEPVLFRYDAPATCPDAEAFVKEVRARTARFQIVQSGEGLRSFEVRVGGTDGRFSGTVRVVDARGALSSRTVDGERCDDVAKALALVTAISIDPKALAAPSLTAAPAGETTATPTSPAQPPAPAPAPPAAAPSAAEPPPPRPPESRPTIATAASQEASTQQVAAPSRPSVTVGLGAFAQSLLAPGPVAGAAAFVGIAFDTGRLWSPELRLGPAVAWSGDLLVSPASATLTWIVARADACPLRWPASGPFAARPCVTADVGAVSVSASGIPNAQSKVRPWGTVGLLALAECWPSGPLFLDAELSLSAALQRDQFFVAPTPVVYQAPSLVPAGALNVGVHFP
ncbi:MAG TPA: hypothetical protein VF765_08810 [Polyangiaceae bacterium]